MTTPRINMSPRGPPTAHTRAELRPHVRNPPTHPTFHSKMCVPYNCYLVFLRSSIGAKMLQIRFKFAKRYWLVYGRRHYISYNTTRPSRQSFVCDIMCTPQCRFVRSERPRWRLAMGWAVRGSNSGGIPEPFPGGKATEASR